VKGGKLAAACAPARLLSLVLSDVPGDDLSEIASGPTVASRATTKEALALIDHWRVALPDHLRAVIAAAPPPIDKDDARLANAAAVIVAAPSHSLQAAAAQAQAAGIEVRMLGDALEGEARDLAQSHAALALQIAGEPLTCPVLLLSGGRMHSHPAGQWHRRAKRGICAGCGNRPARAPAYSLDRLRYRRRRWRSRGRGGLCRTPDP
jgi:glycerate 2-kinase